MLQNYLKIAWRNLLKYKLYSFINVFGLAIGLACTILIMLWVQDELSYDKLHVDAERIYRLNWDYNWNNNEGIGPTTPPPLAASLIREIPEVEDATRLFSVSEMVARHEDQFFTEDGILAVDTNFFAFFDFKLLEGDKLEALANPNSVILTEKTATKYFGSESPIGKFITLGEDKESFFGKYDPTFQVMGVVENAPVHSHIQFDMLTSMSSFAEVAYFDWSWIWMNVITYTKLQKGATAKAVQAKIPAIVETYAPAAFTRIGFSYAELMESGGRWDFILQPFTDVYLGADITGNPIGPVSNRMYVYLFSVVAVFVLLLACINFMNLTTARSAIRAKEVGIRKTFGSLKKMLLSQFLVEAILYSFLALIVALVIVKLAIPAFNQLASKDLALNIFQPWWLTLALITLMTLVGFIAGSYPGLYLSTFQPAQVLKGINQVSGGGKRLRNVLVVFQFSLTIALIASTLLVQQQMNFFRQSDMGFTKECIVSISNENNRLGNQTKAFKESIKNNTQIIDATVTTGIPPKFGFGDYYKAEGRGDELFELVSYMTDADFIPTMDIKIVAGRNFFPNSESDAKSVILNQTAATQFGWDDPIGKTIEYPGAGLFTVVGILRDFNFQTLHAPITAFALFHESSKAYSIPSSQIGVRISGNNVEQSLQTLEETWRAFAPDVPFEYEFLDETFAQQYRTEQRLGNIFFIFSVLTIFIACIGLLGLAAFSAQQRTKEIGVRKVLGASISNLVLLLSKDFTKWVIIANIIAIPLAYFAMNRWLENFAYRIEISWWIFALAGGLAFLVALLTVSIESLRTATKNPADSLRTE